MTTDDRQRFSSQSAVVWYPRSMQQGNTNFTQNTTLSLIYTAITIALHLTALLGNPLPPRRLF